MRADMRASTPHSPGFVFGVAAFGIAVFSSMDALMKLLVLAIGTYDTLLWRTLAGVGLTAIIYLPRRRAWPDRAAMRVHLLRGAVSTVMSVSFFWGLARVPMAQAIGLCFIAPLLALFGAAIVLKERISPRAVWASLIAFAGVAVIMGGQAVSAPSPDRFRGTIAILIAAVSYAYNIILMRQQSLIADAREVAFFQSLTGGAFLVLAAPFLAHLPDARHVPMIAAAAALATVSLLLLAWAYARGEASYLAPTEYTGFIWASLWGWVVFREPVAGYTLAGAALIIVGCLIAARRRDQESVEAAF